MVSASPPSDVDALYRHHHGWLRAWLHRRLGDSCTAADLAHDTFVRLLNPRRTGPANEPRALLLHIARGIVVDHWRRQDVERAYLDALASRPEGFGPSPEETLIIIESLVRVDAMLGGLAPAIREVFMLAQLDGLTLAEIAKRTGLSVMTVRRHIQRGMLACMQAA